MKSAEVVRWGESKTAQARSLGRNVIRLGQLGVRQKHERVPGLEYKARAGLQVATEAESPSSLRGNVLRKRRYRCEDSTNYDGRHTSRGPERAVYRELLLRNKERTAIEDFDEAVCTPACAEQGRS
jgi:hypothetical protein